MRSQKCSAILAGHKDYVTDCAITFDGSAIISGSFCGTLALWDLNSGELRCINERSSYISGCCVTPDGATIVTSSLDTSVRLWKLFFHDR